jgi:serine/threonine-protein kinase
VARVLDVGEMADSGAPYMVMEYLEGSDIGELIERQGSLEIEQACDYALQACEALAAAHAAGIVHRDVKPANLFLTRGADGSGVVKMLDFGISKNTVDRGQRSLTQTQVSMGSPLYMAPEQMRSARDVDVRADVWSMGVVLFEMLSGQMPFMAETMPQLCALVLEADAPRVTELRPDVPERLADVISGCLRKSRDDRFADVGELAEALAPFAPDGVASAERSKKILAGAGMSDTKGEVPAVRQSGVRHEVASTAPTSEIAAAATADDSQAEVPELEIEVGKVTRGTATAFGSTRSGSAAAQPPAKRGAWPIVAAAGLVVVAALGIGLSRNNGTEKEATGVGAAGVGAENALGSGTDSIDIRTAAPPNTVAPPRKPPESQSTPVSADAGAAARPTSAQSASAATPTDARGANQPKKSPTPSAAPTASAPKTDQRPPKRPAVKKPAVKKPTKDPNVFDSRY